LYFELNKRFRATDRQALKPFFPYLRLLLTAIAKLPKCNSSIWRGVSEDLIIQYPKGKSTILWGFTSCTTNIDALKSFLGQGKKTLFNIQAESGVSINFLSSYQAESEVLLPPGRRFMVENASEIGDLIIVAMVEDTTKPALVVLPKNNISLKQSSQENSQSHSTDNATTPLLSSDHKLSHISHLQEVDSPFCCDEPLSQLLYFRIWLLFTLSFILPVLDFFSLWFSYKTLSSLSPTKRRVVIGFGVVELLLVLLGILLFLGLSLSFSSDYLIIGVFAGIPTWVGGLLFFGIVRVLVTREQLYGSPYCCGE